MREASSQARSAESDGPHGTLFPRHSRLRRVELTEGYTDHALRNRTGQRNAAPIVVQLASRTRQGRSAWQLRSCVRTAETRCGAAESRVARERAIVNITYLSALSALAGSAIGGMASIATSWITQHAQDRSQRHAQSAARRERLYGDFIDQASALHIDALTHEELDPSKFVQIYATIGKLRLFASADVVSKADKVVQAIGDIYYFPKRDFTKRDADSRVGLNVLQAFSEACRDDLRE